MSKATLVMAANRLSCCPAKMRLDISLLQLQNNDRIDAQIKKETNKEDIPAMAATTIGRHAKMRTISSLPNTLRVITTSYN
ncbi:hypothetical protein Tco_1522697 [Tanacetum coccineum]